VNSHEHEVANFADEFKKLFCEKAGLDYYQMMNDREYKVRITSHGASYYRKNTELK
jgi:hypothetical protein